MDKLRLFSAFAGYGTDNFALKQLGIEFECVGYSEIDKYAIKCFEQNHKGKNYGDISKIDWRDVPDFDLITGGFPCQDVSVAGKQNLDKGRTILGMELTKALKIKQPKYFLFENVKGLMSKKFQEFREKLIKSWEDCGYKVYYEVLNTKDYGIPQSRSRVFFVGIRKDINQDFKFPEKEELKIFIKDVLESEVDSKYLLKENQVKKLLEGIKKKMNFKKKEIDKVNLNGHQSGDCHNVEGIMSSLYATHYKEPPKIYSVQIDVSGKGYNSQQDRFYNAEGIMCCLPNANPNNKINIFALRSYPRTNNPKQDKIEGRFQNMEVREDGCSNSLTGVEKDNMLIITGQQKHQSIKNNGISNSLPSAMGNGGGHTPIIVRGRTKMPYKQGERELDFKFYDICPTLSENCASGDQKNIVMNCLTEAQGRQGSSSEFLNACEKVALSNPQFIDVYNHKIQDLCPTLTEPNHNSLRIFNEVFRKLTPKECFRLQGFLNDEVKLDGLSDTQAYRLAGNGQSVNVVSKIFSKMF